ncbi:SDR family NAD(P)-dependent oxidoreductase [Georgenia halophila]|uniref:SDR family NAD(P)-dependent oxidoreductase n=1 Tax=Georgenia halophila TaxID=620889 RepID=A0ABP8LJ96_9MICO
MDLNLVGRRAFVSASTAGIGLEIARFLASEGAAVTIHGRDPARAADALAQDLAGHSSVETVLGDLGDAEERTRVADRVASGAYDILVNTAGPFSEHAFAEAEPEHWLDAYRSNVISAVELSRRATPGMTERGWGRIITLGTRGVRTPLPNMIEYSAAKAALQNATTAMARSLAGTGITVNMVSPGVILTPGLRAMFTARPEYAERSWDAIESEVATTYAPNPVGRLGRPADIAAAVAFLASDLASYITGVELPVDGGITGAR